MNLNPNDTTLIISQFFKDVDNPISYTFLANSNPELVVASLNNSLLYLQFNDTKFGRAELILQASSASGILVDTLQVEIVPDDYPPERILAFQDQNVDEDTAIPAIYLPTHFSDRDTDPSLWHYLLANSDTSLLQLSIENDSLKFMLSPHKFGEATITITVESEAFIVMDTFKITVQPVDDPIEKITALPSIMVDENPNDTSFYLQNYYYDVDNSIAFSIRHNSNPNLLASTLTNDTLGLKFGNTANGSAIVVIEAISGNRRLDTIFVQVNPVDNAPHIIDTIPNIIIDEDQQIETIPLLQFFGDIDSDPASFVFKLTVSNQDLANIYISQDSLKMILNPDQFGLTNIDIELTVDGKSISDSFTILVNPVNDLLTQLTKLPNLVLNENPNDTILSLSSYFKDVDNAVTFSILSNTNGTLVDADIHSDSLLFAFSNEFVGQSQIIIKAESDISLTDTFTIQLVDHKVPVLNLSGVPQANELRLNLSVDERLYNQPTFSIDGVTYYFVKTDSSGQAFHYVYPITQTKTYQFTAHVLDKGGNTASKSYSTTMITTTSNNQWLSLTSKISIFIPYSSIDPTNVVSIHEVDASDLNLTDAENNPLNLLSSIYHISFSQPLNFPIRVAIKSDSLGYSRTERNKIGLYFYNPTTEKWLYSFETSLSDIPSSSKSSIMINNNLETNNSGSINASGTFAFFYNENLIKIPDKFSLLQNYPNPFNPNTTIEYHLPKAGKVTLTIYNSIGQTVKTIISTLKSAGYHEVNWDGRNSNGVRVASGIYFYQLVAPNFTKTKRMVLLK
jgi:hypothetical protein